MADEMNLDLVEIAANANPPVCRIIDYQKFLYAQKKKQKEAKANAKKMEVKEIRFGPQTDDHDYNFKLKHAIESFAVVQSYLKSKVRYCSPALRLTWRNMASQRICQI